MFGSKSRHQVAIRGDTCSTVGAPYALLALRANALCVFLLFIDWWRCESFIGGTRQQPLNRIAGPGKMRSLFHH